MAPKMVSESVETAQALAGDPKHAVRATRSAGRQMRSRLLDGASRLFRERIWRPADRVARTACLGSPVCPCAVSTASETILGAILPSRHLFV